MGRSIVALLCLCCSVDVCGVRTFESKSNRVANDDQDSQDETGWLAEPGIGRKREPQCQVLCQSILYTGRDARSSCVNFLLALTHHRATPAKLMLLPQYMGSDMTLKGNPVTMWSMRMPK